MEPPLSKKVMVGIFVDTLKDLFFDRLVSSGAPGFADLVTIGDKIEKGLKDGKIQSNVGTSNAQKKYFGGFQKKKEGETNAIMGGHKGKQQFPYHQVIAIAPIPHQQPIP